MAEEMDTNQTEEDKIAKDIIDRMPQRERLINIWKSEIELYERQRRENGAAVIGIRMIKGPDYDFERINEFLVDCVRSNDLFTKFNENTALLDIWGNDQSQLMRICERIHGIIPENKAGEKEFDLRFAFVQGIPFLELHQNDSLQQVLHRLLMLLAQAEKENSDYIPYDHFLDMSKTEAQEKRLKSYDPTRPSPEHKKSAEFWEQSEDRPHLM